MARLIDEGVDFRRKVYYCYNHTYLSGAIRGILMVYRYLEHKLAQWLAPVMLIVVAILALITLLSKQYMI
jgi:hypothetical protein